MWRERNEIGLCEFVARNQNLTIWTSLSYPTGVLGLIFYFFAPISSA